MELITVKPVNEALILDYIKKNGATSIETLTKKFGSTAGRTIGQLMKKKWLAYQNAEQNGEVMHSTHPLFITETCKRELVLQSEKKN